MKSLKPLGASVCAIAAVISTTMTPSVSMAAPIPVESIAKHDALRRVSMSPDGKHIAGLVAVEGKRWPVISIWKTDNLKAKPIWIPTEEMRYRSVSFLTNDKIIFTTDQPLTRRGKEDFTIKAFIADIDGTNIEEPMKRGGTLNDAVRNVEARNSTVGVFWNDVENENFMLLEKINVSNGSQEIFRLNKKSGRVNRVGRGSESSQYLSSLVNPTNGELLGKQELVNEGGDFWTKIYIRASKDSPWVYHPKLSSRLKDLNNGGIVGFDGSLEKLVVTSDEGSEHVKAYNYDVKSQTMSAPIFESPKFSVFNVTMQKSPGSDFSRPVGVTMAGPSVKTIYTDGYWAGIQKSLEKQFKGMNISIGSRRDKLKKAIITVSDERTPTSYLIFDNGGLTPLGSSRPWMDPNDSGKSRWIEFTARDGLKIPAILSLPPGYKRSQGRIPVMVHPHGGPWARDFMGWDSSGWTQFLTSRGMAVIQPQYRGSTDLGRKLFLAGHEEWGQKMQDDKDDAAKFLVDQGIGDPNRMAIFGYSYGGFAAIAASVRPNSPYNCAISGAGVSSLDRINNLWGSNRINKERQAWTVKGMDPIKNVDKANIPILLYHGSGDRQADTEHSRIFYKAMKAAGKDVKYVEIDKMWHQLPWWPEWHTESLTLIEDFLESPKCNMISAQYRS